MFMKYRLYTRDCGETFVCVASQLILAKLPETGLQSILVCRKEAEGSQVGLLHITNKKLDFSVKRLPVIRSHYFDPLVLTSLLKNHLFLVLRRKLRSTCTRHSGTHVALEGWRKKQESH